MADTTNDTYEQALTKYPDWAWAFNIPEVGDLLRNAVNDPDYSDAKLGQKIMGTNWYKQTQASARQWQQLQTIDPESANAQLRAKQTEIWDRTLSMGMTPDVAKVQQDAQQALSLGWSDDELNDYLVSQVQYTPTISQNAGSLSTTMASLKADASKYMVKLSDDTAFNYAKSILAGEHKSSDWTAIWQTQAKSQFAYSPDVTKALDGGMTLTDYTDPLKERIATTLETSPNAIDLTDPKWSQVLDYTDGKGQRRMMSYSEVDALARSQPEYKNTKVAKSTAASIAETLLEKFGKVAS